MKTENQPEAKPEELEKLEFRSEDVREILGSIPHWTIRSGSAYLLILIFTALIISWFVKYPDIITTQIVLTTEQPPANIVSAGSGYLTLWVNDKEKVKEGQLLGYLSSTADIHVVIRLASELDSFKFISYTSPLP